MVPLLRLTHIGLCVSDLERSLRFYRDLLGFRFEHELEIAGEPCDTLLRLRDVALHAVYLLRDDVRIELLHFASPPAPAPRQRSMHEHGLTHLSFYVDDRDAAAAHLVSLGGTVLEETRTSPGIDLVFLTDPDGVRIELMQG